MTVAVGLFAIALVQAGPLARAQNMLAEGDTAAAVRVLRQVAVADTTMDSQALAALFALQWIGRSPTQTDAKRQWDREGGRVRDMRGRGEAANVLFIAERIDHGEPDLDLFNEFGAANWQHHLNRLTELSRERDPLLAAAADWALAQYEVSWLGSDISAAMPVTDSLPPGCPWGRASTQCVVRRRPPVGWSLPERVMQSESLSTRVNRLRQTLTTARLAPWPFNEFAARTLLVTEIFLGSPEEVRALARSGADLAPRTASELSVMASEFTGLRDQAAEEMRAHLEWYQPLDSLLDSFETETPPAVFWRTAWPFFLESYNARLVAHRARLLVSDILLRISRREDEDPMGPYGDRENLVRRGTPAALGIADRSTRRVRGARRGFEYIDPRTHETVVRASEDALPVSLDLALAARDRAALRVPSGYRAQHVDAMVPLEHQVVQYVREGRRHIDFYATRPISPSCEYPQPVVGFFLLDRQLGLVRDVVDSVAPSVKQHRFRLVLPPGVYVYSLEFMDRACRSAARSRYVLEVPEATGFGLSDLVLADAVRLEEPRRLVSTQPMTARPGLTVEPGQALHFYWEVYGIEASEVEPGRLEIAFEVQNVRRERLGVQRLDDLAREVEEGRPTHDVTYSVTAPPGDGPMVMGLTVQLPLDTEGVHLARVEVYDRNTDTRHSAERGFFVGSENR